MRTTSYANNINKGIHCSLKLPIYFLKVLAFYQQLRNIYKDNSQINEDLILKLEQMNDALENNLKVLLIYKIHVESPQNNKQHKDDTVACKHSLYNLQRARNAHISWKQPPKIIAINKLEIELYILNNLYLAIDINRHIYRTNHWKPPPLKKKHQMPIKNVHVFKNDIFTGQNNILECQYMKTKRIMHQKSI